MRIAQVAPLIESVPPKLYGGTERVASYLTEELVRQGHQVTLFASGDSETSAELVPIVPRALRLDRNYINPEVFHLLLIEKVYQRAADFDIIHFHLDALHFPLTRRMDRATITTMHGRLDLPELDALFREFREIPVVSISNAQRTPLPQANWQATVYNGVPAENYTFRELPGRYLAFLGRISPEKRVDRAIEIARRVGMPLRIAAKVDRADEEYFQERIRPMLDDPLVEFIGEIDEREKDVFLGEAYALLLPIDWPEPFGLVMIEAMACGTPVVAYRHGSVPEVVDHGVTGFIVDGIEDAAAAVQQIDSINRRTCRQVFEERFSARRMARDYATVYEQLIYGRERTLEAV
ncbi:MAG TPA: glycosyltransferase family 4 protein [Gammaproteobacteria bacterium]|nr:glycosyltransferase family 4 protein [Gammaproteobacteria bacterium]